MANCLDIRLFGGLRIALDGEPVSAFMSQKVPALLAYLAVSGRAQRRDDLAALLWGEMPDADARNNLRQALANLRKLLEPCLTITRETVELNDRPPVFLDTTAFEAALALPPGLPAEDRAAALTAAAALYTGDFLAGFFVREAPAFEEWMLGQRARYREQALLALHTLTQHHLVTGQYDRAIQSATRLLALDEWREEAHCQLMLALARTGQRSAALAQYQRCRRLLEQELGVEPAAETAQLYERIRAVMLRPRHNLPAALSDLVGRADEIAELRGRLRAPGCQMLTLVGAGGIGKTQLALAVAHACRDDNLEGAWWAQLAPVARPADLVAAIADALGVAFSGSASMEAQLVDFLRGRELLLALDNFEHLISPQALDLLSALLRQAPGLKLLVTSRVRLNLMAEQLFDVSGLRCPADDGVGVAESPAAQLFAWRAQRLRADFRLDAASAAPVARICRMVEGLPLALELAAAWVRAMSPEEIAAELGRGLAVLTSSAYDAPARHVSLAAVFEQSWALLDEAKAGVLARLAVFPGDFDSAAAAQTAAATEDSLRALVDCSWLRSARPGRFALHPLARQFALEKLGRLPASVMSAARRAHARHFADLAGQHESEFHCGKDREAMAWMLLEADNIRSAWEWGARQGDSPLLEQFLESFLYFYDIQGRYQDCLELLDQALRGLAAASVPAMRFGRGRVLALHAAFAFRTGSFALARQEAETALASLEPQRPHRDVGHARLYLGAAWYGLGDLAAASEWFLAASEAYAEAGHTWGIGAALDNAGYLAFLRDDAAAAEAYLTRALDIAQQTGSRYLLTGIYDHLATLTAAENRLVEAMSYVARCRAVLDELDRPYIVGSLSLSMAQIAMQAGDWATAESYLLRALEVARATGNRLDLVKTLSQLGRLKTAVGDTLAARNALREAAAMAKATQSEVLAAEVEAALAALPDAGAYRR